MKTNVVMIRRMGIFNVQQRTKDGMFNATELLKQWNSNPKNPKRDLSKFWEQDNVNSFIEIMMQEENMLTAAEGYVKSRASRGKDAGTWMHPILFLKFAMWINPRFEYFVIRFVQDQLLSVRNLAGDYYNGLTSSVQQFSNVNYSQLAKGLNYVIFGKHEENLRQNATEIELKQLTGLQQKLAFSIDMGYIITFDKLIEELRKLYHLRLKK